MFPPPGYMGMTLSLSSWPMTSVIGLESLLSLRGGTIVFAMECHESGLISQSDTDGIKLRWGSSEAIIELLRKMSKRKGFGAVRADGGKKGAERTGRGADQFASTLAGKRYPSMTRECFLVMEPPMFLTRVQPGEDIVIYRNMPQIHAWDTSICGLPDPYPLLSSTMGQSQMGIDATVKVPERIEPRWDPRPRKSEPSKKLVEKVYAKLKDELGLP